MKKSLYLALILGLFQCTSKKTETANTPDEVGPNSILGTKVQIDSIKSIITWIGSKPGGKHNGTIGIKNGFVTMLNDTIVGAHIQIDLNTLSVKDIPQEDEDNSKLRIHLLSDDFLDALKFPVATFKLQNLKTVDATTPDTLITKPFAEGDSFIATGQLQIKNISHNITFPISISPYQDKTIIESRLVIDRTRWGISYGDESALVDQLKDQFIYNDVSIGLYLEVPRID
ncbi:MAG: YceI family protein [Cyclobacteriaceae bacterium]|nr:YceI family protein [Cyclobacteriaceae bacterium HetDA_MAG_MS6]